MNLEGGLDLLKFEMAGVADIRGKRCIVIPVDENDIHVRTDDSLRPKSAYLNVSVVERREPSQFNGSTHYVKQSFSKAYKERHTAEQLKAKPYLGDMKPFTFGSQQQQPASDNTQSNQSMVIEADALTYSGGELPF
jgi:hypothetical protein